MRRALEVADVFRRHGAAYRELHAGHLSRGQRRVMGAIETCRSAVLGGHVEQCNGCGQLRIAYNSCRNRHCPKCQGLARAQWLADRQSELLPVPYFHVVFTVPAPIAQIALHNKAVVYGILFTAAAETLRVIAADPRHLGAEIGLVAVLHTWGQNLHHHPHVHCVVPGGGPSVDRTRWIGCRPGFFLPAKVLSRLYRRLFLTRLQAAFDAGHLRFFGDLASLAAPPIFAARLRPLRTIRWVVYAKRPFGGPEQVLDYLGRYTHRVAIANSRLVGLAEGLILYLVYLMTDVPRPALLGAATAVGFGVGATLGDGAFDDPGTARRAPSTRRSASSSLLASTSAAVVVESCWAMLQSVSPSATV